MDGEDVKMSVSKKMEPKKKDEKTNTVATQSSVFERSNQPKGGKRKRGEEDGEEGEAEEEEMEDDAEAFEITLEEIGKVEEMRVSVIDEVENAEMGIRSCFRLNRRKDNYNDGIVVGVLQRNKALKEQVEKHSFIIIISLPSSLPSSRPGTTPSDPRSYKPRNTAR